MMNSFAYTLAPDGRYYYQGLDSDGTLAGSVLIYSSLQDFQGTEEELITPVEFDSRFVIGQALWYRS